MPKAKGPRTRFTLRLPADLWRLLIAHAARDGVSLNEFIVDELRSAMKRGG